MRQRFTKSARCSALCFAASGAALVCGAATYLLFRRDTYLHTLLRRVFGTVPQALPANNLFAFIAANWLGDFFWGLALGLMLFAVLGVFRRRALFAFWGTVSVGIVFELLQKTGLVHGTFDLWDMVAEGFGALLAVAFGCWVQKKEDNL